MRLERLYSVLFHYPEAWFVELDDERGIESQHFLIAEGRCEGRLSGRLRGANHPRRRTDLTYLPDFQGVIETDDGATIAFDLRGFGRSYPEPNRQVVGVVTHLTGDEHYRWLNDAVCPLAGEVRPRADESGVDIALEVAELVWEPPANVPPLRSSA